MRSAELQSFALMTVGNPLGIGHRLVALLGWRGERRQENTISAIAASESILSWADSFVIVALALALSIAIGRWLLHWPLSAKGAFVAGLVFTAATLVASRWLLWPLAAWLWHDRTAPQWYLHLASNPALPLVLGSALAAVGGYVSWWWQEHQKKLASRKMFNSLLRWELLYMSPRDDPLQNDPRTARRIGNVPGSV